jgi:hypothetical protein
MKRELHSNYTGKKNADSSTGRHLFKLLNLKRILVGSASFELATPAV